MIALRIEEKELFGFKKGNFISDLRNSFDFFGSTVSSNDGSGDGRNPESVFSASEDKSFFISSKKYSGYLCDIVLNEGKAGDLGETVINAAYYDSNDYVGLSKNVETADVSVISKEGSIVKSVSLSRQNFLSKPDFNFYGRYSGLSVFDSYSSAVSRGYLDLSSQDYNLVKQDFGSLYPKSSFVYETGYESDFSIGYSSVINEPNISENVTLAPVFDVGIVESSFYNNDLNKKVFSDDYSGLNDFKSESIIKKSSGVLDIDSYMVQKDLMVSKEIKEYSHLKSLKSIDSLDYIGSKKDFSYSFVRDLKESGLDSFESKVFSDIKPVLELKSSLTFEFLNKNSFVSEDYDRDLYSAKRLEGIVKAEPKTLISDDYVPMDLMVFSESVKDSYENSFKDDFEERVRNASRDVLESKSNSFYEGSVDSFFENINSNVSDFLSEHSNKAADDYNAGSGEDFLESKKSAQRYFDENVKRKDLCAVEAESEILVNESKRQISYSELAKREDLCAVVPESIKYSRDDQCAVVPISSKVRREDLCAVTPESYDVGGMFRLILDERMQSAKSRHVRVEDGSDNIVSYIAKSDSVLAAIDSLLERTGLVGEYEKTGYGVSLKGVKGLNNANYVIGIVNNSTGKKRYIKGSIDSEVLGNNETVSIEYFKSKSNNDSLSVFNDEYFSSIRGWNGKEVNGAMELASVMVTGSKANDNSMKLIYGKNEKGSVLSHKIKANSHLYLISENLKEKGFSVEYGVSEFLLRDGEKKERAAYIKDIKDSDGRSVMKKHKDAGYLIETVDRYNQRSEALASDGITALSSEQAIGKQGDVLSIVGMLQGVYDRRKTHKAYSMKKAA